MDKQNKPWVFSHTQLALWKLCKRRFYNKYILGKPELKTPNMAAGTWLCQFPIEEWESAQRIDLDAWPEEAWLNFLAEFNGDDNYDDPIFTLKLAKQILAAYQKNPVAGKVVEIEKKFVTNLGGFQYQSKPDFMAERKQHNHWTECKPGCPCGTRTTWDIKLKTFNQRFAGDTFYAESKLSAFDDQCLGQAICADANSFGQIQFFVGKKDATLVGPVYVEQSVNPILRAEWIIENSTVCKDIANWKNAHDMIPFNPWPKNDQACHAFGRDCAYLQDCQFGFDSGTQKV